jgi:tripartite-type tricarboxylate transporter receptor subunit TctC
MKLKNALRHICAALAAFGTLSAAAADFPSKPVRIVVPYAPGGTSDIVARAIAVKLAERLKQAVLVENRGGGGGSIGTEAVVRADADGHTLLFHSGAIAVEPSSNKKLSYVAQRDLTPVMLAVAGPFAMLVNPALPVKSIAELIAYAKANPGKLNFGTPGNGTSIHLATELFKAMAGIDIVHVPYKGAGPALTALTANEIQMAIDPLVTAKQFATSGKLRALAVTTSKRWEPWAEMPTVAESGLPGYDTSVWYMFFVPAGTPAPVVARLNTELRNVLTAPEMRDWLRTTGGLDVVANNADQAKASFAAEIELWARIIRGANIKID